MAGQAVAGGIPVRRPGIGRGGVSTPAAIGDLFICDVFGASPKDDLGTMEHPIFSLSTKPDRRILKYEHNGTQVEVIPSVKGRATIHDKDILIYCISQLMAGLNAGREVSRTLQLKAHDLLLATRRDTGGDSYLRLREAFERLAGTRITTNIVTGGIEATSGFGLIESWEILRKTRGGRMISVMVTLSEWLFRAVLGRSVLTTVEATVGGGVLTIVMNGEKNVESVHIDPSIIDPEDAEMLEDLMVAAVNEANKKVDDMMAQEMSKITGGMHLPGMF